MYNMIENIFKTNPSFDLEDFNEEIFSHENIKIYGLDLLVNNVEYLDKEILKKAELDKDKFLVCYSKKMHVFCNKMHTTPKKIFLDPFINQMTLIRMCDNIDFYKYPNVFFCLHHLAEIDSNLKLEFYERNKSLIDRINYNEYTDETTAAINFLYRLQTCIPLVINNINDLYNVEDIYKELMREMLLTVGYEMRIEELKDVNSKIIFDLHFNELSAQVSNMKFSLNTDDINDEEHDYLIQLSKMLLTKNCHDLSEAIDFLCENKYLYDSILEKTKNKTINNIIENINIQKKYNHEINLEGQPFTFLVHKLSCLNDSVLQKKFFNNFDEWYNNYDEQSIISTSLINENYFGLVNGAYPIIGFNNLDASDVLDMGVSDLYSFPLTYNIKKSSENSSYLMYEQFMNNSVNLYNEIVLKRFKYKKAITPNYVLNMSLSDASTITNKKISNYFNIPIYNINMESYLDKMNINLKYFIEHNDLKMYLIRFCQMIKSFNENEIYILQYLNSKKAANNLETLINNNQTITPENKNILLTILYKYNGFLSTYDRENEFEFKKYYEKIKKM